MNESLKGVLRRFLPRTLSEHTILGGPLRGSEIVTSWHDYPAAILGRTEDALLDYFKNQVGNGETWLDIGAHYGYTAIALSKLVGPSGRVFAFEPMLTTSGCISRARFLNNIPQLTVIPMALGDCQDMTIDTLQSVRGMIDSTLQGSTGFKETFVASRLDWLWPRISGSDLRIHGVKIDVQGMELQVLEGMATLARSYTREFRDRGCSIWSLRLDIFLKHRRLSRFQAREILSMRMIEPICSRLILGNRLQRFGWN